MAADSRSFVLDASCIVKTFRDESDAPGYRAWHEARLAEGATLLGPTLLHFEIGQVAARHFPDARTRSGALRNGLRGIQLVPVSPAAPFAYPTTTYYDGSYLAVAAEHGAWLVTFDQRMLQAAAEARIRTLSRSEIAAGGPRPPSP